MQWALGTCAVAVSNKWRLACVHAAVAVLLLPTHKKMVESLPTYAVALIGVGGALLAVAALSWALAPRKMSLKDKVVVVTGGSSGIGKATAAAVLQAGGHVALVARRQDQLESKLSRDLRVCAVERMRCCR